VRRALQLAERTHRGQPRKGTTHPYLLHPVAVAQILAAVGADDDLLCAGYLDDAVEEGDLAVSYIEDEFGSRVARMVAAVTKPDHDGGRELSFSEKVDITRKAMRAADHDTQALKAADLIANLTDLACDHVEHGPDHWRRLFGDRADGKLDHYEHLADQLAGSLERHATYGPLAEILSGRREQIQRLRG
jgi:(p)ppGpp synthase/HD superfamily hydrolase